MHRALSFFKRRLAVVLTVHVGSELSQDVSPRPGHCDAALDPCEPGGARLSSAVPVAPERDHGLCVAASDACATIRLGHALKHYMQLESLGEQHPEQSH